MLEHKEEIIKIDRWIKSYLELENIPHIDLSDVPIDKRSDFIINKIIKNPSK